jgi:hypothetical protein
MRYAPTLRYAVIGLVFLSTACTTTITKTKNPEFGIPIDSLAGQINGLVTSQHVNLDGKEITTNGMDSSVLEVDILNGKDIPQNDERLKTLGRSIAIDIHNALKDKNEYKAFMVLFVKVDSSAGLTKRSWKGCTFSAGQL